MGFAPASAMLVREGTAVYSARLKGIHVPKEYKLRRETPQSFEVIIPKELKTLPVHVESLDNNATIDMFLAGTAKEGEEKSLTSGAMGFAAINVSMPDNTHLKEGQTPTWSREVLVKADSFMSAGRWG